MAKPAERKIDDMQLEIGKPSYIGKYLAALRDNNPDGAEQLARDIYDIFSTEQGLRVLILFEKAVLHLGMPEGADPRALQEWNGARNFNLELRRLVAHGRRR